MVMIRIENLKRVTSINGQQVSFLTHDIREMDRVISENLGKDLCIEIKPVRKGRSLKANSYAWTLITEMANKLRTSKDECYLMMLQRYGQPVVDKDGNAVMFSALSSIPQETLIEHVGYVAPLATKGYVDGKEFTHYRVLKGSHEFDTREMSIFIDGIVSECKDLGIETLTPTELERMKSAWGKKNAESNHNH